MVGQKAKELLICYVDGTKDQFLDVDFTLIENGIGEVREIILIDNRKRYVYIQLNSVLKYMIKK